MAGAPDPLLELAALARTLAERRMRLVVHAGTPKTGTKALQRALARGAQRLEQAGIWYPPSSLDRATQSHKAIAKLLYRGDAAGLAGVLADAVRSAPARAHTIVVSAEGVYNHWWDFPAASKAMLAHLATAADVELWVCFREPVEFALALYAQMLRNDRAVWPAYGTDVGLEAMLDDAWFVKRLDYLGFVREAQLLVGEPKVRLFRYGPDIVSRFFRALGADPPGDAHENVHASLRQAGVDLMRVVNRYDLRGGEKAAAAALVQRLDAMIGDRCAPLRASPRAAERIAAVAEDGWQEIASLLDRGCT